MNFYASVIFAVTFIWQYEIQIQCVHSRLNFSCALSGIILMQSSTDSQFENRLHVPREPV